MQLADKNGTFSYQDYLTWQDDERWELIDGRPYNMTPAPGFRHQRVVGNLYLVLRQALQGKRCVVGIAPTDVVLSDYDVVQPDIFVVCDQAKIADDIIRGAPDLVIEVASPATARRDRMEKKRLYEAAGVEEYILLDPVAHFAERFLLESDGRYGRGEVFGPRDLLVLQSLDGVEIPLWEVFETPPAD
jgi:Uma2 family endonuclease